jgi:hypothetical protein
MDNRVLTAISQRIEYIVRKRHKNFQYIKRAFTDGIYWLNTVQLSPGIVISNIEPNELRRKSILYYNLG